jgi:hypothetical protein
MRWTPPAVRGETRTDRFRKAKKMLKTGIRNALKASGNKRLNISLPAQGRVDGLVYALAILETLEEQDR